MAQDYIIENISDFSLQQTLECGQCFHFKKIGENEYGVSAKGRLLHIKQEDNRLVFYNTTREEYNSLWQDYFDLSRDYGEIKRILLEKNQPLKSAIEDMWGIRLLNQDFEETLISFIISQNKQIPHIKKIVEEISQKYGNYLGSIGNEKFYSFPDIKQLQHITEQDLRDCKTGFRAPYIIDAIKKITDGMSRDTFCGMDNETCRNTLKEIKGVGDKVANCVMLFGLARRDCFPVDVWIKRVMEYLYFDKETPKEAIEKKAAELFGEYGGYAQQYLFYYGRENKLKL